MIAPLSVQWLVCMNTASAIRGRTMSWTWQQRLKHLPGSLEVSPSSYGTSVYFPGKDRRSAGSFWKMTSTEIEAYIGALEEAWQQFEALSASAPEGAELNARGKMGIGIHVARWPGRGITLHSYHELVAHRLKLDAIIEELRSLPAIAAKVIAALEAI